MNLRADSARKLEELFTAVNTGSRKLKGACLSCLNGDNFKKKEITNLASRFAELEDTAICNEWCKH